MNKKPWITCYDENKNIVEEKTFNTYKEIKRELKKYALKYYSVTVTRTRRGEWGQWFEKYITVDKRLYKIGEGWY
jgi:hypothetical protein